MRARSTRPQAEPVSTAYLFSYTVSSLLRRNFPLVIKPNSLNTSGFATSALHDVRRQSESEHENVVAGVSVRSREQEVYLESEVVLFTMRGESPAPEQRSMR